MILISDFIRKGDNGEMKNKLKFPDTPWHIEYTKKAEDDPRRHKARCIYIEGDICHCGYDKYFLSKCGGSSHCNHYSETSIEDEEEKRKHNEIDAIVRSGILNSERKMKKDVVFFQGKRYYKVYYSEDEAVMIPYDEKLTNEKIAQIVWKHIRKSK